MAILLFSIVVLIGFIPAVFCLDRLFAINFARAARMRPESRDAFWQPRGFAATGSPDEETAVSRRPIGSGISWLIKAPDTFSDDSVSVALLRAYRISAALVLLGILGVIVFLFFF